MPLAKKRRVIRSLKPDLHDTPTGIRAGGVLEAGDALSSELCKVSLPKTAEDLMPPVEDGGPLSWKSN